MNRKSLVAGAALALLVAGCSTSKSGEADPSNGAESASEKAKTEAEASGSAELPDYAPAANTPAIKSLGWGEDGSLRLGFADGRWAKVDPGAKEAALEAAVTGDASVLAVSPAGKLALVDAEPPMVVRLRDRQTVMRLRSVDALQAGGFFAGGTGLFVAEPSGKIHVWNRAERDLDQVETKDLKQFMARQSPDFTAGLSPLAGQVLVTAKNRLIMGTDSGKVLSWKPDKPNEVTAVVKLPSAARSFGFDGRYVAATSDDGSLRVISLYERSFVPWSMKETGELAAASPELLDKFAVAGKGELALRTFADGASDWSAKLPQGELCGLSFSPDGKTLAVCVDSGVVLVESATGKPVAALRRAGDGIEWRK